MLWKRSRSTALASTSEATVVLVTSDRCARAASLLPREIVQRFALQAGTGCSRPQSGTQGTGGRGCRPRWRPARSVRRREPVMSARFRLNPPPGAILCPRPCSPLSSSFSLQPFCQALHSVLLRVMFQLGEPAPRWLPARREERKEAHLSPKRTHHFRLQRFAPPPSVRRVTLVFGRPRLHPSPAARAAADGR